jgi:predicted ATPase
MPMKQCDQCGGLGYIRFDVSITDPDFGKMRPCPNAEAHAAEHKKQLLLLSGLKDHERYTLEDLITFDDITHELLKTARTIQREPRGWLYLWGGPGTGKTLVLQALVNEWIETGQQAYYATFADLLDLARSAFSPPKKGDADYDMAWRQFQSYAARFARLRDIPLLAIDEFDAGKINPTAFMSEFRARLIDHRYRDGINPKGGMVTVFAGNEDPARLPPWLKDRVEDARFTIHHHDGPSARQEMWWHD